MNIPKVSSSRPASDRGVTFHFKHGFVSKRGSGRTSAMAHQDYIEREEAADREDDAPVNFGTLGETPKARRDFWRKLEEAEAANGRVQCRLVVEIPYELDHASRRRLAQDFCREFERRGLPFWCSLHAPTERNDARNFHMHIVYSDRPAGRLPDGRWDFEVVESGRYTNRSDRRVRPLKQNKDREAQGSKWVRTLRERYAELANEGLEQAGEKKRLDPRSYRESGVPKAPTTHLGPKAWSLETSGDATKPGGLNAVKEILFRTSAWSALLTGQLERIEALLCTVAEAVKNHPSVRRIAQKLVQAANRYREITMQLFQKRREEQIHQVVVEALTLRDESRRRHLLKQATLSQVRDRSPEERGDGADLSPHRGRAKKALQDLDETERRLELIRPKAQELRERALRLRREQEDLVEQQNRVAKRVNALKARFDDAVPTGGGRTAQTKVDKETRWSRILIEEHGYSATSSSVDVDGALSRLRPDEKEKKNTTIAVARFSAPPTPENIRAFVERHANLRQDALESLIAATATSRDNAIDAITRAQHARAARLLSIMRDERSTGARENTQVAQPGNDKIVENFKNSDRGLDLL